MSKLFSEVSIEDVVNNNCSDDEREALLDTLERTVKKMATTLARKASFLLSDYATAKQLGINKFSLELEKGQRVGSLDFWNAKFEYGNKQLTVIASIN